MTEVRFVDTTCATAQQSLWAYNIRTGMIVPIAEPLDDAGFEAIELGGPMELPKCVKELREDPWERYRLVIPKFKKTPLRLVHGTRSGFAIYPDALHQLYDTCMANVGVSEVRISDSWNDPADWAWRVKQAKNAGLKPIINLIYTVSPRHTDEYYAAKIRRSHSPRCLSRHSQRPRRHPDSRAHQDRGAGDAQRRRRHDGGTAHPLHHRPRHAVLLGSDQSRHDAHQHGDSTARRWLMKSVLIQRRDERARPGLQNIDQRRAAPRGSKYFTACARQENLPIGKTPEYDYAQYVHQIPGGMISNLRHQLRRVGMEDKIDQTLEEAAQVRAEFGYPIMVTPLSQFVGSQAAINVIVGERYKQVTDQTIEYAMGIWGKEGAVFMDENVKEKILNRPRAKEIADRPHPTDSLQDLRRKYGGTE